MALKGTLRHKMAAVGECFWPSPASTERLDGWMDGGGWRSEGERLGDRNQKKKGDRNQEERGGRGGSDNQRQREKIKEQKDKCM